LNFNLENLSLVTIIPVILGFMLGRIGSGQDRKRNVRPFIKTDELTAQYKLKNVEHVKKGTKLFATDNFQKIEHYVEGNKLHINEDFINETNFLYLSISNIGDSLVLNPIVKVHLRKNTEAWNIETTLPTIEKGEVVYICLDTLETLLDSTVCVIDMVEIIYDTIAEETLIYKYTTQSKGSSVVFTESYYSTFFFGLFKRKIHTRNSGPLDWIFIYNK
jgi:hypothetical protein